MSSRYYILGLLLVCNIFKYIDRQVLFPLFPLIQKDLGLSDARLGLLASGFMIVYMCAAPVVGLLADRGSRKNWISAGIAIWSFSRVDTALRSLDQMVNKPSPQNEVGP